MMRLPPSVFYVLCAALLAISESPARAGGKPAPYLPSAHIAGFTLDWPSHDRRSDGSDNWPITWSDDDHQYTAWGDGGGFGGSNSKGRVSLGVARVEGPVDGYTGFNVWGGLKPENPAQFEGKSYGILSVAGDLYMWWGPGSGTTSYGETRLAFSNDKGGHWTLSDWDLIDSDEQLIMPTICNFGRDYAGARDAFVYHYFIRKEPNGSGLGIHLGGDPATGKIDLARVPADQLLEHSAYEFFSGIDGGGEPTWSADPVARVPVFEDPNGVGWNASVSYNEPLGRYLLMTEHTASFQGQLGVFDAPEPWGPWTTVSYLGDPPFGDGEIADSTFFWNFANKWLSTDGLDFTLVFTGVGSHDSWNTVRGSFQLGQIFGDGFESGDTSAWSNAVP